MIGRLVLAAAALLASPVAAAQDSDKPIAEIAADLAYGYCPLFLAEQFPLTGNPQLAGLGFGTAVEKRPDARFGTFEQVSLKRTDGEIAFGGAVGKACNVVVTGPHREAALQRLRDSMSFMGFDFKPVPHDGPKVAGLTVEVFKAKVETQVLNVQLIQGGGPAPAIVAQLFVTEE